MGSILTKEDVNSIPSSCQVIVTQKREWQLTCVRVDLVTVFKRLICRMQHVILFRTMSSYTSIPLTHLQERRPVYLPRPESETDLSRYLSGFIRLSDFPTPPYDNLSFPNEPSLRESQLLAPTPDTFQEVIRPSSRYIIPSSWSDDTVDNHRMVQSRVAVTARRHVEVITLVNSDGRVGVGRIVKPMGIRSRKRLLIKEVLWWERHVVVFYCKRLDVAQDEVFLVARNEQVEWSTWSTVKWYLFFPFLQSSSPITDLPV
jgi:hypothetical protein